MDWGTHVVLAARLLETLNLDKGAAIYSVIPVIDTKPAHFHRVYAHILENQPDFLDAAIEIFSSKELADKDFEGLLRKFKEKAGEIEEEISRISAEDGNSRRQLERKAYAITRIAEEAPIFYQHAINAGDLIDDKAVTNISSDKLSAAVSLLSHTYFDTWNNPIQLFLPLSSLCSGQWGFWEEIDYMKFRGDFYKKENILPFRRLISSNPIWKTEGLKPAAMIKAMIVRIGEMGQPSIPYEAIDMGIRDFLRYMEIDEYQRIDNELDFCKKLEGEIHRIILENYGKLAEDIPEKKSEVRDKADSLT